ncbi:Putative nuclease HARBI1 [Trachymyrmex cornetzi]|uniref:Nuclease HARBI1 n=1 Tax=Trachymyrmex cornetzi TaxID=471704 RepID=A0A151K3E7_9HYME|nr:Putative nuclease HARBI1 [Trachymyrmex cornetzi]
MENFVIQGVITLYKIFFLRDIESDNDSEEEELIELYAEKLLNSEKNVPSRIKYFIEHTVLNSTPKEFQSHFRITQEAFEWLYGLISPHLQTSRSSGRQTIDAQKQILSVLWILATPDSYRSIASRFDVGKSSLFACFVRVIKALNKIAPKMIVWPTEDEAIRIEQGFSCFAGIRGVIGAIDGTFVPIKAPKENAEVYINRKCFYGITLQGICDDKMKFTDCFTGYPSSVSDVRIFKNSDIYTQFINNSNITLKKIILLLGIKLTRIKNGVYHLI